MYYDINNNNPFLRFSQSSLRDWNSLGAFKTTGRQWINRRQLEYMYKNVETISIAMHTFWNISLLKKKMKASEITQQVKVFAANLTTCLVPESYMAEEKLRIPESSSMFSMCCHYVLTHACTCVCTLASKHAHMHHHKENKSNIFRFHRYKFQKLNF